MTSDQRIEQAAALLEQSKADVRSHLDYREKRVDLLVEVVEMLIAKVKALESQAAGQRPGVTVE